ncbi:Mediator of RNA polymerase II transcription subunit 7, partial [Fragariocoptes setiger]
MDDMMSNTNQEIAASSPSASAAVAAAATPAAQSSNTNEPSTVLAFPPPPLQYIRKYTNENVKEGKVPPPPKPITDGQYHMFGQLISTNDAIIASLESHGTKRLYPRGDYDHKKELKKMNASILVNFLDLVDVLVRCPDTDKRSDKCNDLALLFINFHHLINELRPHQARETIRVWMSCQKKSRYETTQRLMRELDRALLSISDLTTNVEQKRSHLKEIINQALALARAKAQQETAAMSNGEQQQQLPQSGSAQVGGEMSSADNVVKSGEKFDELMCKLIDDLMGDEEDPLLDWDRTTKPAYHYCRFCGDKAWLSLDHNEHISASTNDAATNNSAAGANGNHNNTSNENNYSNSNNNNNNNANTTNGIDTKFVRVGGVHVATNIFDETYEAKLVAAIESFKPWTESVEGRLKQDFGPKVNFKRQRARLGDFRGFPAYAHHVFDLIRTKCSPLLDTFIPVELCNLDYNSERNSYIRPHYDDTWLWGDRLISVNLLSTAYMRLTKEFNEPPYEIVIEMPPRSALILSGEARNNWQHSIMPHDIRGRRIAMTWRELSAQFLENRVDSELKCFKDQLLEMSKKEIEPCHIRGHA